MSVRQAYTTEFYEQYSQGSFRSAEVVIGVLSRMISFRSVIDVGCGIGTWLRAVEKCGISDVVGVDGEYVDRAALQIPADRFLPRDLTKPLKIDRTFDLAMSLEVAEHLPAKSAATFVNTLVDLAPIVLFSAAIPFQGGNQHVNEQWPDYWAELFKQHGYAMVDCVRARIWNDPSVEWWYAQNIFLYANQEGFARNPGLSEMRLECSPSRVSVVHPKNYLRFVDPLTPGGFRRSLSLTAVSAKSAFQKGLNSLSMALVESMNSRLKYPGDQRASEDPSVRASPERCKDGRIRARRREEIL